MSIELSQMGGSSSTVPSGSEMLTAAAFDANHGMFDFITATTFYGTSPGGSAGCTATTTSGSSSVSFSNATNLANGQAIFIAGIAGAFYLAGLSGTTANLQRAVGVTQALVNVNAGANVTNGAVTFSYYPDTALVIGYNYNGVKATEPTWAMQLESDFLDYDGFRKVEGYFQFTPAGGGTVLRPFACQVDRDNNNVQLLTFLCGWKGAQFYYGSDYTTPSFTIGSNPSGTPVNDLQSYGSFKVNMLTSQTTPVMRWANASNGQLAAIQPLGGFSVGNNTVDSGYGGAIIEAKLAIGKTTAAAVPLDVVGAVNISAGELTLYATGGGYAPKAVFADTVGNSTQSFGAVTIWREAALTQCLVMLKSNGSGNFAIGHENATNHDLCIGPTQGTESNFTHANSHMSFLNGGQTVSIGGATPTAAAILTFAAGSTTVAPIRLASQTLVTTPAAGNIEYDGTHLYFTDATNTRRTITAV